MKNFRWWRKLKGGTWYYLHTFPYPDLILILPENKYWTRNLVYSTAEGYTKFKLLKKEIW